MSDTKNKKIICPNCSLTPILTLDNLKFNIECLSNHKNSSETIDTFLSDKVQLQYYECSVHKL